MFFVSRASLFVSTLTHPATSLVLTLRLVSLHEQINPLPAMLSFRQEKRYYLKARISSPVGLNRAIKVSETKNNTFKLCHLMTP